jgi:hypothetical protein
MKNARTRKGLDANTMRLQYLDTLRNLGTSVATKFVFPMEFPSFLKPFISQPQTPQK